MVIFSFLLFNSGLLFWKAFHRIRWLYSAEYFEWFETLQHWFSGWMPVETWTRQVWSSMSRFLWAGAVFPILSGGPVVRPPLSGLLRRTLPLRLKNLNVSVLSVGSIVLVYFRRNIRRRPILLPQRRKGGVSSRHKPCSKNFETMLSHILT